MIRAPISEAERQDTVTQEVDNPQPPHATNPQIFFASTRESTPDEEVRQILKGDLANFTGC